MGQGSTVRLRQPRGVGQARDAASGFPCFAGRPPFATRLCRLSWCVFVPIVRAGRKLLQTSVQREELPDTHSPFWTLWGRSCTPLALFFLLPMGEGGPAHRSAEREGSGAGVEGRLFQKAATRPSPCALKKRAAYAPRCAQPSPGGRGKVALRLHCFSLSECKIPHAAHDAPCHPGSAAGAIRDGTESHAEARTARRDDPGQRWLRCWTRGKRLQRAPLHSNCTVFHLGSAKGDFRQFGLCFSRAIALPLHCFSRRWSNSSRRGIQRPCPCAPSS